MMGTRKSLIAILILFECLLNAQAPQRFYTKFGGEGDDIGYSGKQTLDRQYIVAGSTSSFGGSSTDVYLVKVDSMGSVLWEKNYGGLGNEVGKAVIQLPDSGFVIAGFTSSYGAGGYDAIIIKTDKNGNLMWQKTFGGTDWDFGTDLVLASDGNIVIVGNTVSFGNGKKDGFVVKYDLQGNEMWRKFIGGVENEELRAVIKTNDNMIATVGFTESRGDVNGDGYFLKLDLNGDTLFTKTFGGLYKDYANDLVQKSNGEYIMVGAKTFTANTKTQSYYYSITTAGTFTWENNYYSSSGDEECIATANSKHLPDLTAYLRNVPVPSFKTQGNIILGWFGGWAYLVNSFGGTEEETFYSVEPTIDGGYLSVGSTSSFGALNKDIMLIKQDSTLITYTSVVGVREKKITERITVRYLPNSIIEIGCGHLQMPVTLQLMDLYGKIIYGYSTEESNPRLEMRSLNSSIYFIKLSDSAGNTVIKKVIN
ncbi:MAG: hypothetical protein IT236_17310 [Bacteroidia bacterium]|nr:hypothetical protein [Bacteroidia bacterium]